MAEREELSIGTQVTIANGTKIYTVVTIAQLHVGLVSEGYVQVDRKSSNVERAVKISDVTVIEPQADISLTPAPNIKDTHNF